jgi:hypothetical protein
MISNIKNASPSEELQRRSAGILFTMNDLLKKSNIFFKFLKNLLKSYITIPTKNNFKIKTHQSRAMALTVRIDVLWIRQCQLI